MSGSFIPIGAAGSKVIIDLSTRRQALRDATARMNKRARVVDMNSPVTAMLKDSVAALDAAAEREARRAKARQLVAQGVAMIREHEGENAADEWLTQCMSVARSVK